ncbi:MAG: acyl-CoA thioesterase [Acidimicrobiia bacterium]|nr:acyl-CoA thioesterase [Acidimicrobiia bacterium]
MAFRTPLRVRFNEIDPYMHVNHAVYLTYFEYGRTDALERAGIPIQQLAADGIQLVITKAEVRFIRPATAGDHLEVVTFLGESRRASHIWRQRVVRPDDDCGEVVLVEGDITIAVTDERGRPTRPPAWLQEAFVKLESGGEPGAEPGGEPEHRN